LALPRIADKKSTMPALSKSLERDRTVELRVAATDLYLAISGTVNASK